MEELWDLSVGQEAVVEVKVVNVEGGEGGF